MLALIVGTLLAVGALAYVLLPLLSAGTQSPRRAVRSSAPRETATEHEAVVALREIEFDRVTGKLSDADYDELKARYTERALHALRGAASDADDPAEAAILAHRSRLRSCAGCGPRPEADAVYCSSCGAYLPGACSACGAAVTEPGAGFCTACGRQLAA